MKIFVPIKENSQRVKRKNFRKLHGVPLWQQLLLKLTLEGFEVYVDTDSEEIIESTGRRSAFDHITVYKRKPKLCGDDVSVNLLIKNFIKQFALKDEIICQVHVTSPFLTTKTLESAARHMQTPKLNDSVVACTRFQTRLWRYEDYGMCPVNHNPMNLVQTQELPTYCEENSLFYIFNSDVMLETGNRIGRKPYFYITTFPENHDIDTEEDWRITELLSRPER